MTIDKFNFAGKKAIVRVDFNVPLDENGKITDDTRIRGALPTLKKVLADGGSLIIMSHMGKPKGKVNAKYSLSQIVDAVSEKLGVPVQFAPDCAKAGDAAAALKPGEVLLLENLRFYPEEEGKPVGIDKEDPAYEDAKKAMKASQKEFAKTLASYADCYINDAFGTAHRKHASTAVIADYFDADNKMLGYLMEKEVQAVDNILKDIKRPFTAIMGGSKVSTKIGIIENLMDKVDNLILCGGMTYTFAKAQGGKIGNSIVEDDKLDLALDIIAKAKAKGVNLVLGSDCVAADAFSNDAHTQVVPANNIPDGWEGLDAGPETQKAFAAAMEIYHLSKLFPKEETYSLTDQIRRSSRSVNANITEAWRKRRYEKSFINKLNDADGEAAETQNWLDFAFACEYIDERTHRNLYEKYDEILGMIVSMTVNSNKWTFSEKNLNPANPSTK